MNRVRDQVRKGLAAALLALHVSSGWALDRNPLEIPLREYLGVLIFSILGGFVAWYTRFKRGHARAASLLTVIGESCTSVMAGLLTFFAATYFDAPKLLTVSMVALAGHMGARAIAAFEAAAEKRFGRLVETKPGDLTS